MWTHEYFARFVAALSQCQIEYHPHNPQFDVKLPLFSTGTHCDVEEEICGEACYNPGEEFCCGSVVVQQSDVLDCCNGSYANYYITK